MLYSTLNLVKYLVLFDENHHHVLGRDGLHGHQHHPLDGLPHLRHLRLSHGHRHDEPAQRFGSLRHTQDPKRGRYRYVCLKTEELLLGGHLLPRQHHRDISAVPVRPTIGRGNQNQPQHQA